MGLSNGCPLILRYIFGWFFPLLGSSFLRKKMGGTWGYGQQRLLGSKTQNFGLWLVAEGLYIVHFSISGKVLCCKLV